MSDSQVGGRRGKNVRNHVWIVNGIICDVLSSKKKHPVDIGIFDYRQCFDSLWLQECLSDIYSSGVRDDKLALLFNINTHVKVAVKTPVGKSRRGDIFNVITQGMCSDRSYAVIRWTPLARSAWKRARRIIPIKVKLMSHLWGWWTIFFVLQSVDTKAQ